MLTHNKEYYTCCCNVHVHTCTFIIALIVVLFWSVVIAGIIYSGELIGLLICVPPLFSYGCLLLGNRLKRPGSYCPFLICNLALVIGAFLFALVFYLTGAAFISHNFQIGIDGIDTFLGSVTILIGTGIAVYAFFQFYYFWIVYRDYEFVKEQASGKQPAKPKPASRQRRFYVDPKKLNKLCPCRDGDKKKKKTTNIRVESTDDEVEAAIKTPDRQPPKRIDPQSSWRSENDLSRRESRGLSRWPSESQLISASRENRGFSRYPSESQLNGRRREWPSECQLSNWGSRRSFSRRTSENYLNDWETERFLQVTSV